MPLTVVDATMGHAEDLLTQPLRQEDVDEWVLANMMPVQKALPLALGEPGVYPRALLNAEGRCICMWGITVTQPGESGMVWLLASKEAEAKAKRIHRLWKPECQRFHLFAKTLVAFSHHRNTMHHHWLEAVGFSNMGSIGLGVVDVPYILYEKEQQ